MRKEPSDETHVREMCTIFSRLSGVPVSHDPQSDTYVARARSLHVNKDPLGNIYRLILADGSGAYVITGDTQSGGWTARRG